jgi:hypothetical protein
MSLFESEKPKLEPEDFYYSSEGYIVFTEKYHLKRGHCCKSGCKHCPYGFDKKTGMIKPPNSSK